MSFSDIHLKIYHSDDILKKVVLLSQVILLVELLTIIFL